MPFQIVKCESCGEKNIDVLVIDGTCYFCLIKQAEELDKEVKAKPKPDKELEELLL